MAKFFAALSDKIDSISTELCHAVWRNILREIVN